MYWEREFVSHALELLLVERRIIPFLWSSNLNLFLRCNRSARRDSSANSSLVITSISSPSSWSRLALSLTGISLQSMQKLCSLPKAPRIAVQDMCLVFNGLHNIPQRVTNIPNARSMHCLILEHPRGSEEWDKACFLVWYWNQMI